MTTFRLYSKKEEILNAISHGVGALLAVIGATTMITLSACFGNWLTVTASVIYGVTLTILFTSSTLYHAIPFEKVKQVLRILDHDSIYLLIAGTYTPITLILLRGSPKGIGIFAAVWILAVVGIILNAINMEKFKRVSMLLYIGMGWAMLWDVAAVVTRLGRSGFAFLLSGGIGYTAGIIFYKMKRIPYMHGVWHLFVLAGGILHYFCVLLYVLPPV
jgi:hemolysin III